MTASFAVGGQPALDALIVHMGKERMTVLFDEAFNMAMFGKVEEEHSEWCLGEELCPLKQDLREINSSLDRMQARFDAVKGCVV